VVEVAEPVQNRLKELFKEPCRGAVDAINIACCLTFEAAAGMPIPFITGDARQRDAAAQMKLHVVWTGYRTAKVKSRRIALLNRI
jgi:hypothetical protein